MVNIPTSVVFLTSELGIAIAESLSMRSTQSVVNVQSSFSLGERAQSFSLTV